jgi:hypothetical protein
LYPVEVSAAVAGNTAAAGKAADKAAVEQMPFIRLLREKSKLMKDFSKQQNHFTSCIVEPNRWTLRSTSPGIL